MLYEWLLAWHRAIWFPVNWLLGLESLPEEPPDLQLPLQRPVCPEWLSADTACNYPYDPQCGLGPEAHPTARTF